jgi:hypothetical protein
MVAPPFICYAGSLSKASGRNIQEITDFLKVAKIPKLAGLSKITETSK